MVLSHMCNLKKSNNGSRKYTRDEGWYKWEDVSERL